jgi:hypothetical protein
MLFKGAFGCSLHTLLELANTLLANSSHIIYCLKLDDSTMVGSLQMVPKILSEGLQLEFHWNPRASLAGRRLLKYLIS